MSIYSKTNFFLEKIKDPKVSRKIKICRAYSAWSYYRSSVLLKFLLCITPLPKKGVYIGKRSELIIASLTSFPDRINDVYYAIKSIMLQTIKPDRIVLWLASSQFLDQHLPSKLLSLQEKGLEILFCDDLRSHKKYYYMLQEQKTSELVITFDDDIIYNAHTIERAYNKHKEYPNAIVVNQAKIIEFNEMGMIGPYDTWSRNITDKTPQKNLSPLTGSGCLYPYGVMNQKTFDWATIKEYALNADDLWIAFMSKVSGTDIVVVDEAAARFSTTTLAQGYNLSQENCVGGGNDKIVKKLSDLYSSTLHNIKDNNK